MKKSESGGRKASLEDKAPPSPQNLFLKLREELRADIDKNGIVRVPSGSRELLSLEGDGYYGWQFYLRTPLLRPQNLIFIGRAFWAVYRSRFQERPFQIAGVESASVPIITSLLLHAPVAVNAFTIRKERKKYGLRNLIEGKPNGLPVVLIDDLTSTGHNAIWHAVGAIADARLSLYPATFVVVFKGRKSSPRTLPTSIGVTTIESLFTLEDFNLSWEGSFTPNAQPGTIP